MNQTKPYTIGLDLGGTNSEFGIVDHEGNIIASSTMKTGGFATADDYADAAIKCLMPILTIQRCRWQRCSPTVLAVCLFTSPTMQMLRLLVK